MSSIRSVIVGTAGHIDHGKSSLVRALTGTDPDRLAEEQARGMTIDLGFAAYVHGSGRTVGMIDVPGHERFIKNMVAGATSVDLVVLVVAADDGVMPQTREHLEILSLLGVRRGLVVLSKIDLVDPELVAMALDDVADFVAGTFLQDAPRLPFSSVTGEGLPELRAALDALIDDVPEHEDGGPFRLPVQRVFSAKGHGLVVTGVPVSGRVALGDALEVVRGARPVRVRGAQAYGRPVEVARAGHSTALNLAGATVDDVHRGDVVADPGIFRASRFVAVAYQHVDTGRPLRVRHPVRLHAGTAEVLGRAVVLEEREVEEVGAVFVQLRLDEPVVTAPGDRVLVRDAASMAVLGGGLVLEAGEGRLKRGKARVLADLGARRAALGDVRALALATVSAARARGATLDELARQTARSPAEVEAALAEDVAAGDLLKTPSDRWLDAAAVDDVAERLVATLKALHKSQPLMEWVDLAAVRAGVDVAEDVLRAVLTSDLRFETAPGGKVRRRGHRVNLAPALREAREKLLKTLLDAGSTPPAVDASLTGLDEKDTRALTDSLRAAGEVVPVGEHLFHREVLERMTEALVAHGNARDGRIDIPELRDELGTTRKYLIPLLEHFDARGYTARHGDKRVLRKRGTTS
ncbi:MAG: selenocysteine-specific translation elongation factor [Planctomycetes bacterium]|nr:selenocysteine-specific translation elongation factor [Planctomycetota bacterium]